MNLSFRLESRAIALAALFIVTISSCKKSDPAADGGTTNPTETNTKQTPTTNRVELSTDSIFLYAKQLYYWNDALPSYDDFTPRKYNTGGSEIDIYNKELFDITQIKIDPSTKKPIEYTGTSQPKYSYINDKSLNNPDATEYIPGVKNSVDLEGNGNDIGIRPVSYLLSNTQSGPFILFVTAVYDNSPADKAGVKRGWSIEKINGRAIGDNYTSDQSYINSSLSGESVVLEGTKYQNGSRGAAYTITLTKKSYQSSPIYATKVITTGTKTVGYLAYARFSKPENSDPVLDAAFNTFASSGVTDLIVDLRYNGGGYVETATYLTNLIAPSSVTGPMFVEYFNETMQSGKATILKNQPYVDNGVQTGTYADLDYTPETNTTNFSKKGPLTGINNIVFIVTGNTASASELLINNLKPHMNVQLVGDTTYGKPVGFFPFTIQNRYEVYMPLFETKNSSGEGGYYAGMTPNYGENDNEPDFWDNPLYQFGDESEGYLAKALDVINPSRKAVQSSKASTMSIGTHEVSTSALNKMHKVQEHKDFVGMIETHHTRK